MRKMYLLFAKNDNNDVVLKGVFTSMKQLETARKQTEEQEDLWTKLITIDVNETDANITIMNATTGRNIDQRGTWQRKDRFFIYA